MKLSNDNEKGLEKSISLKIAMVGYGAMGRIIERIAKDRGHTIVTFDTSLG